MYCPLRLPSSIEPGPPWKVISRRLPPIRGMSDPTLAMGARACKRPASSATNQPEDFKFRWSPATAAALDKIDLSHYLTL